MDRAGKRKRPLGVGMGTIHQFLSLKSMKKKSIAAVLSFLHPGFGHLYADQIKRGLIFFVAHLLLVLLLFRGIGVATPMLLLVSLMFHVIFRVAAAVDAARSISAESEGKGPWYARAIVCLVALLAVGFLLVPIFESFQTVKTFQAASVNMEPALKAGDRFLVDLQSFKDRSPERGEIVAFRSPENPDVVLIQRVVAVAGETVSIREKQLFLNGEPQNESWVVFSDPSVFPNVPGDRRSARDHMEAMEIPAGTFLALGDNRDLSYDSRWYGPVPVENLVGGATYVYWSGDRSRIGTNL